MMKQGIVLATFVFIFFNTNAKTIGLRNEEHVAHAIVCKNPDASIQSVELLDIFEARTKYELAVITQGPTMEANLTSVQKKLITLFKDAGLKNLPSTYIDDLLASMTLEPKDIGTLPVDTTITTPAPQGCELLPVAFYENNTDLTIYSQLWNAMDGLNRAAVVAHAAIYRHEAELGETNLERVRKIVAHLFSNTKFAALKQDIPADANACTAFDKYDPTRVLFEFFKYDHPTNDLQEVLQFTKFRGVHPYGLTKVISPKWAWPKEDGDLFLEVDSPVEQFSEMYIRREWTSTGVLDKYYIDEVNGDFQVRCAKDIDAQPAILKIIVTSNYEPVAVGGTRVLTFEISNVGKGKSLAMKAGGLNAPFGFLDGQYPGTGATCSSSLQPGSMCTINLVFAPTIAGSFSGTFVVHFNDGTTKQQISIDIEGTSLAPAVLTISDGPLPYNFGMSATGSTRDKSFTITNKGGVRATNITGLGLASPFVFKGGNYPGIGGTCTANLEAGAVCYVVTSYEPALVGTYQDTLEISYSSGAVTSSVTREMTGSAVLPALLSITEADPYDFGVVATGAIKTVTLTVENKGKYTASSVYGTGLGVPFTFFGGYYPGKNGTCSSTLNPGAKCTIMLQFSPKNSGNAADAIEMQYNNGAGMQMTQRLLAGVGAAPALLVVSDGPNYKFGYAYPGTSLDHTFTITNTGAAIATTIAPSVLKSPFVFEGGFPGKGGTCGKTLGAATSCTFVISFTPDQVGEYQETLKLSYHNGVQNSSTTRIISGLAGQAAELVMTTGTIYDFGATELGATKEIELMIVNTGGSTATQLQDGGGFTAPYSYKGGVFPGIGGTCGTELAPNDLCTVMVTYIPQKTGTHKETMAISYFNGHAKQIVLQYFDGTGVSGAREAWAPWNFFALTEK